MVDPRDGGRVSRLLIVRLSSMGDVIHTLPAAQALRAAFPNSTIGWLIEERWAELLCAPGTPLRGPRSAQRPLVDWVHTVNLVGWRKSFFSLHTLQNIAKVWNDIRSAHYDVAIDLQGAMRSAVLARWSGARVVYGAAEPRESPASLWYTRQAHTRGLHVIEQNLSIAEAVMESGTDSQKMKTPRVEFPRDPVAEARINQHLAEKNISDFAILNPGAGWGAKRWPAERYGDVARELASLGLRTILNYGPGEQELAQAAQSASGGTAESMNCTITELIALTRRYRPIASRGGVGHSSRSDLRPDGSGPQRPLRYTYDCATQSLERHHARAPLAAGPGIAGDQRRRSRRSGSQVVGLSVDCKCGLSV